jgi:hypothetical protein
MSESPYRAAYLIDKYNLCGRKYFSCSPSHACPNQAAQPVSGGMRCLGMRWGWRVRKRSTYTLYISYAEPGLCLSNLRNKCLCLRKCSQHSWHPQHYAWTIAARNYKLDPISAFCTKQRLNFCSSRRGWLSTWNLFRHSQRTSWFNKRHGRVSNHGANIYPGLLLPLFRH